MLTGARLGEVLGLQWKHTDLEFLLIEIKLSCSSRVVLNRSLVLQVMLFCSSLTIVSNEPTQPVVVEPMIRRLPSRINSFFNDMISSYLLLPISFDKSLGIKK